MTIAEAIQEVNELKPNMYGDEIKITWLSRLDTRIYEEILLTHALNAGEEQTDFSGYTYSAETVSSEENQEDTPAETPAETEEAVPALEDTVIGNTELLVGEPYDEMYIHWLAAQIDYHNREIDGFNSTNAMFDAVYSAFRNAYNRSHMPLGTAKRYY